MPKNKKHSSNSLWGSVPFSKWASVPALSDRLATRSDVESGRAVFVLKNSPKHRPLPLELPSLAIVTDDDSGESLPVIVVQAERSKDMDLFGFRFFNGGNGVCSQ